MNATREQISFLLENIEYSLNRSSKVKGVDPTTMVPIWEVRASLKLALDGEEDISPMNFSFEDCVESSINFARIVNKYLLVQAGR